jgi:hypothetical protein
MQLERIPVRLTHSPHGKKNSDKVPRCGNSMSGRKRPHCAISHAADLRPSLCIGRGRYFCN